jgi:hypothetical protein
VCQPLPIFEALFRFLAHLGDHRIAGHRREKAIDVDRTETLGKGEVLFRG